MKRRLLLIDDEETILFALRNYFVRRGYTVDCARELEEAEALAVHFEYDLVIADLCLSRPGSTEGLELVRHVRRHCRRARIIVVSGFEVPGAQCEALRRGADAFVAKPRPLGQIAKLANLLTGEAA